MRPDKRKEGAEAPYLSPGSQRRLPSAANSLQADGFLWHEVTKDHADCVVVQVLIGSHSSSILLSKIAAVLLRLRAADRVSILGIREWCFERKVSG
jgi:hypothetical protein